MGGIFGGGRSKPAPAPKPEPVPEPVKKEPVKSTRDERLDASRRRRRAAGRRSLLGGGRLESGEQNTLGSE